MRRESLWPIPPAQGETSLFTVNIKEILREQAEYLKDGTNGAVKAEIKERFRESTGLEENCNRSVTYRICNDKYYYNVVVIKIRPLYPVIIYESEGDCEKSLNGRVVMNEDELISVLREIFQSPKVQLMIWKLRQLAEEVENNDE